MEEKKYFPDNVITSQFYSKLEVIYIWPINSWENGDNEAVDNMCGRTSKS